MTEATGWVPKSSLIFEGLDQLDCWLQSAEAGQLTTMCWLMPAVGVLPFPKPTYTVPSAPTTGWPPWSWSQAFGSDSPLNAVQYVVFDPLISIPSDQVKPPSVDWLK